MFCHVKRDDVNRKRSQNEYDCRRFHLIGTLQRCHLLLVHSIRIESVYVMSLNVFGVAVFHVLYANHNRMFVLILVQFLFKISNLIECLHLF